MDIFDKVEVLGTAAQYDLCGACFQSKETARRQSPIGRWIYPAAMPNGQTIMLLKTLMSNACENECSYCANRCRRNAERQSFTPEELAKLFMTLHAQGLVKGLFLSSAVARGSAWMMQQMLASVEILRHRYRFQGYIHLKLLPGSNFDAVEQATNLADRVSVNLEVPAEKYLSKLTRRKNFGHFLRLMGWVKNLQQKGLSRAGQTTQFMVGAAGESDQEILSVTDRCYTDLKLNRVYYSAFQPVADTPLEHQPATPLIREHRLYQSDFLLRRYGFEFSELGFDQSGNLPLTDDPKTVWANNHPERFPIEVNTASKDELVRIPGIGPVSAARIVKHRRTEKIRSLAALKTSGAVVKRTTGYVLLDGKKPKELLPAQMELTL
jgi:predicted DNA-binding helix-hairpin-helix protein